MAKTWRKLKSSQDLAEKEKKKKKKKKTAKIISNGFASQMNAIIISGVGRGLVSHVNNANLRKLISATIILYQVSNIYHSGHMTFI